jgi:hypothetical protein
VPQRELVHRRNAKDYSSIRQSLQVSLALFDNQLTQVE